MRSWRAPAGQRDGARQPDHALRGRLCYARAAVPEGATIADALAGARRLAERDAAGIDPTLWDTAPVGVFGEARLRTARCAEGDRIELYRPLRCDPRARRRERVRHERRAGAKRG
jgi:uncharacterized protein